MQSLNLWVGRHREAVAENRRLHHQVELLTMAFGKLVTFLNDDQLDLLERELARLEEEFPPDPTP
jgi:hypothetical protein